MGADLLHRRGIDGAPNILFRSLLEGCFTSELPSAQSVARVISDMEQRQCLIVVEVYLDLCWEESRDDLNKVVHELVAFNKRMQSEGTLIREVRRLADRKWIEKGAVDIEAIIGDEQEIPADIRDAVRAGIGRISAFNPLRTRSIIEALASRLPNFAGELFLLSRLPFRELPTICRHLSESDREAVHASLALSLSENSPFLPRQVFDELPVSAISRKALPLFIKRGFAFSPAEVVRWISPLGSKEAAGFLDALPMSTGDPVRAGEYLSARIPLGQLSEKTINTSLASLANGDFASAQEIVKMLLKSLREKAMEKHYSGALSKAALGDPDAFITKLAAAPEGVQGAALKAAAGMALTGRVDATQIARSLPREQKTLFVNEILSAMSKRSSSDYYAISVKDCESLAGGFLEGSYHSESLAGIVNLAKTIAQSDPGKALKYLN